ncbi:hypothetical protein EBN03_18375 [Nocardia stercoris]|uniref:Uncharacterized protein n=1 Tax=Nocardia stercoris TaxID=2483361 RepID=A0A3M2L3P8_9NOCA|nr:hypothetical protein EBN03_18375 [Nocardia stercoris]
MRSATDSSTSEGGVADRAQVPGQHRMVQQQAQTGFARPPDLVQRAAFAGVRAEQRRHRHVEQALGASPVYAGTATCASRFAGRSRP